MDNEESADWQQVHILAEQEPQTYRILISEVEKPIIKCMMPVAPMVAENLKESESHDMRQYQEYRNDDNTLYSMHNQATDPLMRSVTPPLSTPYILKETRGHRVKRTIKSMFAAVFRKINQLIGLALTVLLLLLFTRFLLNFFEITTSVFTGWIHLLTDPLVYPFENLVPSLPFNGFSIDVTTLVAIVVWTIAVLLVRQFIRILVGKW